MPWIDVSIPLQLGMTVWPGDLNFSFEPDRRISNGANANTSFLHMSTHTGTHCDAPWHFVDNGKKLHEIDPSIYFGQVQVIEWKYDEHINAERLKGIELLPRVLFKTKNSTLPTNGDFFTNFLALLPDTAQLLVDKGVRLVGIDYLSIAPYRQSKPTHEILLKNNVFIVEGLRLERIPEGIYEFVVLPLAIVDSDGAPCRAFINLP
ncbi:MAG TPA: cyclase family protein [Candidatus Hydrogenedens sp.]|nr:cyclase family protein [Candidatus Hydrogenedens sp.]HOL19386.1 cyclase family protein [Candidatus Hydrogenedens sp.]HPP58038.1 cyclase family protein [Candidatus Hydrogenedens sp.]